MFYFHELWYQKTHTPTSTNRDVLDSLHCWQTSQGIIRSWLYIIAECQISLESAAYTKSHLTMLLLLSPHPLLLGFILLSRISDSLSSFTFFLLIFMRAGKFLRIMDLFLTYVLAFFLFPSWQYMQRKKNAQCNSATFTVNYLRIAFDASSQTLLFPGLICLHYGMLELGILFHRVSPFLFLSLFLSLFYHFQLRLPRIYW